MRAVANNQESSNLVGIRVGTILVLGWGLAGAIGVLAAAMLAPSAGLTGTLMLGPFLLASVAAVLGGLDSPDRRGRRRPDHRPDRGVHRRLRRLPRCRHVVPGDAGDPAGRAAVATVRSVRFRTSGARVMDLPVRVSKGGWQNWARRAWCCSAVSVCSCSGRSTEWSRSGLGLLADALIIAIAVTGLNLITGYTGQLSLGHAAFFAIGAFTSAMLVTGQGLDPVPHRQHLDARLDDAGVGGRLLPDRAWWSASPRCV